MKRIVSLVTALSLLLLQGASASRYCACLDELAKPSCCQKDMPCCDKGECSMHADAEAHPDMALELFKAADAVSAMPLLYLQLSIVKVEQIFCVTLSIVARVRGPDIASYALRAPPIRA